MFLFTLLLSIPAFGQNADLTVQLTPESRYNAGELATVRAKVTNLGPDTATAAGVRLSKPAQRFVGATTVLLSMEHRGSPSRASTPPPAKRSSKVP